MIPYMSIFIILLLLSAPTYEIYQRLNTINSTFELNDIISLKHRYLGESMSCEDVTTFHRYFYAMDSIYGGENRQVGTCLPLHKKCGWPAIRKTEGITTNQVNLPLFVLSVGLEGAGHHLWTEIMGMPLFDCVWINGRHYHRDIGDGVPRSSITKLAEGFKESFKVRADSGKPPCRRIYDAEDSFPTGAIRKSGRLFMRPDLVSLQQLDGILYNIKYLIILRNTTDTVMSSLRRNFFPNIDTGLRTVEHTLTYIESALRGIPCERVFIAHYEHVLADPRAYKNPLAQFLELSSSEKELLNTRLSKKGKIPLRKAHKFTQYDECKLKQLDESKCYEYVLTTLETFLKDRDFMWPTFAGNGYDFKIEPAT